MKGLLKFITCGSVDDGKSTLIGHILYDANKKHCAAVRSDGTIKSEKMEGSIHQVGAAAQNAPACNGWVYWYYQDQKRGLVCIDELRQVVRAELYPE
jgi:modification methylase